MRTAILSDIHGNYPALLKVLEDARMEQVDQFIFLGDYFMDFPYSNEVVQTLMGMENAYIIKGNKEAYMRHYRRVDPEKMKYDQVANLYHCVGELTQASYDFLNNLPEEMYIQLSPNTRIYATHVSPIYEKPPTGPPLHKCCRNFSFHQAMLEKPFTHAEFLEDFRQFVNSDTCRPYIQGIDANVILYAHNHMQSYAYCGDKLIINPGSCGVAMDFDNRSAYTLLEETKNGLQVIEKKVAYDIEAVIAYTKASPLYEKSPVWHELIFLDLRLARSHATFLMDIVREIAADKNESGEFFSNETWAEAGARFFCGKP